MDKKKVEEIEKMYRKYEALLRAFLEEENKKQNETDK